MPLWQRDLSKEERAKSLSIQQLSKNADDSDTQDDKSKQTSPQSEYSPLRETVFVDNKEAASRVEIHKSTLSISDNFCNTPLAGYDIDFDTKRFEGENSSDTIQPCNKQNVNFEFNEKDALINTARNIPQIKLRRPSNLSVSVPPIASVTCLSAPLQSPLLLANDERDSGYICSPLHYSSFFNDNSSDTTNDKLFVSNRRTLGNNKDSKYNRNAETLLNVTDETNYPSKETNSQNKNPHYLSPIKIDISSNTRTPILHHKTYSTTLDYPSSIHHSKSRHVASFDSVHNERCGGMKEIKQNINEIIHEVRELKCGMEVMTELLHDAILSNPKKYSNAN